MVAGTSTVTATQWSSLIAKTNAALAHQGQATITPTSVTAGSNITYYGSISTGVTNTTTAASGTTALALTDGAAQAASYTGTWGNTGNRGVVFTHTVSFTSGDAARYFFNAGGRLKLSFSRSGGSATTRNTEWTALATACASVQVGSTSWYKVGGTGSPTNLSLTGYWGLTTSEVQRFLQYDGYGAYSTNYIAINAYVSGTAANGGYPVITIKTYWINAWSNVNQQTVDGTSTTNLIVSSPATTYLTNSWGTPTVGVASALY